jgi:hypothetical protein
MIISNRPWLHPSLLEESLAGWMQPTRRGSQSDIRAGLRALLNRPGRASGGVVTAGAHDSESREARHSGNTVTTSHSHGEGTR